MIDGIQDSAGAALRLLEAQFDSLKWATESLRTAVSHGTNDKSTESLALLVAVLAVFFGPIVQLSIAKREIRASVLSGNRQKWIDKLRSNIADFLALWTL